MSNSIPPIHTIRDGALKAVIWENESTSGSVFHAVTLSRTYRTEEGRLADTSSFVGADLLRVKRLLDRAYDYIADLRRTRQPAPDEAAGMEDDGDPSLFDGDDEPEDEPRRQRGRSEGFNRQSRNPRGRNGSRSPAP